MEILLINILSLLLMAIIILPVLLLGYCIAVLIGKLFNDDTIHSLYAIGIITCTAILLIL